MYRIKLLLTSCAFVCAVQSCYGIVLSPEGSSEKVISPYAAPSPSPGSSPCLIIYSADDEATLYINAIEVSSTSEYDQIGTYSADLKVGDVISIQAWDSSGGGYGVIAVIEYQGKIIKTGSTDGDGWRAKKKPTDEDYWMKGSYSTCSWQAPDGQRLYAGNAKVPKKYGAKYVWAKNAGENDVAFLRYRLGGEGCGDPTLSTGLRDERYVPTGDDWESKSLDVCMQTKISFTGDNAIHMWVNGNDKGVHQNPAIFREEYACLQKGDVVAVRAEDRGGWYGANVHFWLGYYHTTGNSDWKAIPSSKRQTDFIYEYFNTCKWPKAVVRPKAGRFFDGKAEPFPYPGDSAYVWAQGAGVKSGIYMRLVIGGERC